MSSSTQKPSGKSVKFSIDVTTKQLYLDKICLRPTRDPSNQRAQKMHDEHKRLVQELKDVHKAVLKSAKWLKRKRRGSNVTRTYI